MKKTFTKTKGSNKLLMPKKKYLTLKEDSFEENDNDNSSGLLLFTHSSTLRLNDRNKDTRNQLELIKKDIKSLRRKYVEEVSGIIKAKELSEEYSNYIEFIKMS